MVNSGLLMDQTTLRVELKCAIMQYGGGLLICKGCTDQKRLIYYLKPVSTTHKLLMLVVVLYLAQYPYGLGYLSQILSQILSHSFVEESGREACHVGSCHCGVIGTRFLDSIEYSWFTLLSALNWGSR